jgi:hypothetical protein
MPGAAPIALTPARQEVMHPQRPFVEKEGKLFGHSAGLIGALLLYLMRTHLVFDGFVDDVRLPDFWHGFEQ